MFSHGPKKRTCWAFCVSSRRSSWSLSLNLKSIGASNGISTQRPTWNMQKMHKLEWQTEGGCYNHSKFYRQLLSKFTEDTHTGQDSLIFLAWFLCTKVHNELSDDATWDFTTSTRTFVLSDRPDLRNTADEFVSYPKEYLTFCSN